MDKLMSPDVIHHRLENIIEIATQDQYKEGMSHNDFTMLCNAFGFDMYDVFYLLDCEEIYKPRFVEVPILTSIINICIERLVEQNRKGTYLYDLRMALNISKFIEKDGKYGYECQENFYIVKGFKPETVKEDEISSYYFKEIEPWQMNASTQKRVEAKIEKWCKDEDGKPTPIPETDYFRMFVRDHPHKSNYFTYEEAEQCLDMDRVISHGYKQLSPEEIVAKLDDKDRSHRPLSGNDYIDYLPTCHKFMADADGNIYEYRTDHSRLIRGIRDAFKCPPEKKRSRKSK